MCYSIAAIMKKNFFKIMFMVFLYMQSIYCVQKLYVFYPTVVRPHILQKKISLACSGLEVTVFGRFTDFKTKVKLDNPDAIITKPDVLKQFSGYKINLQGQKKGRQDEKYVLLSIGKKVDFSETGSVTIGAIDFLGRKEMENLLASLLISKPKVKRVTKVEDLLPLLSFNMVNAIFISENQENYFKTKSQLNFIITPLQNANIGIISLALKTGKEEGAEITNSINKLDKEINLLFEIEKWK